MPIADLIRPEIADLEAYTPILPLDVLAARLGLPIEQLVKLDANENPYGPSPRTVQALADLATTAGPTGQLSLAIYPDPNQTRLRAALSAYVGQPEGTILAGAGADELIDLVLRLFIAPGDGVIDCPPTFGMYKFDTGVNGGRLITVPRLADFSLDIPAIEAAAHAGAKVLFLTHPNNPTGNLTPLADIERLLKLALIVVVDEAYIEFASQQGAASVCDWVPRYENLVVLRTFSKWAGLAGMRVGYGIFPAWMIEQLWKIKQPYNISLGAETAAIAALEDRDYLLANVARIVAERERLLECLRSLPFLEPHPSASNFILCRVTRGHARELKLMLERLGILVRYYHTPLLQDYIRVSVGTPKQTDTLIHALETW
ncbi:histidinol-phosphate transaminase [Candidatus Oscillochloris fontis]|uniref:histidinol-phosphate transaminase n=1 Tax=Candidatus Oscillochloris fontis TaxID=2496868 RepID=UPI00158323FD|nr:histidinol-phosphate transaminase [Candidatus Oscillochloris fontis]